MLNINDVLYKYIVEKYGSIAAFSDYSGIPLIELNAILIKDNISTEIRSGFKLCKTLNVDIEELVFHGEIKELERKEKLNRSNRFVQSNHGDLSGLFKQEPEDSAESEISAELTDATDIILIINELRDRYMRLSELEKKEVLNFVNKIYER